jgi:putative addiction module component (TIGR02574 family)
VSTTSTYLAEEALALPANQRAELARLLIDSLEGDRRSDTEIRRVLETRLVALTSGKDAGHSFEEIFGGKP